MRLLYHSFGIASKSRPPKAHYFSPIRLCVIRAPFITAITINAMTNHFVNSYTKKHLVIALTSLNFKHYTNNEFIVRTMI